MKKLCIILPLALILCFMVGCQDKEAMAELEEFKAQAAVEEQNKDIVKQCLNEIDANDAIENAYRDKIQQPEKVLKVIGVKEGMVIGEPGAGRGYFTLKLAKKVGPSGLIYANDINKEDLQILQRRASELGLTNIQTIVGIEDDPLLPDGKLDMAIMVWVYAALTKPVEFLKNLKKDLKPAGTLVMIISEPEKTGSKSEVRKRENILKNITKAGYRLSRIETFLEKDTIYILEPE